MEYPLVTFLSPCYNHSNYVIESLESIRRQTYPNIQHIIIDDCSRDDSAYKIQKWIDDKEYNCQFIQHKVNKGISYSLNESIELANGIYWSPLATDDVILPERTEIFVEYFKTHQEAYMVTSDCKFIDLDSQGIILGGTSSFLAYFTQFRKGYLQEEFGTYESLLAGNYIPSSLMIKKEIFKKVGLFDTSLKVEDWDMWLKIARLSRIGYINKFLTFYRYNPNNVLNLMSAHKKDNLIVFLKQYKTCDTLALREIFYNKYFDFIHHELDLKMNRELSILFLKESPKLILFKAFINKLLKKIK